jgi:hypothetical protein
MENLTTIIGMILAVSLASERLVTMIKTLFPGWLADEKKTETLEIDLSADKWRRIVVMILAFIASWGTSTLLTDGYDPFGQVTINSDLKISTFLLGLLASGGSAFWSNLLGYSKAVKDIRVQQKAKDSLAFHQKARAFGLFPQDSGTATKSRILSPNSKTVIAATNALAVLQQPLINNIDQIVKTNRI